ncbi:DNA/RNA nuclease SfsA [Rubeoparvulum massiliense]|uniref:DNA/RNA nuclease SfsA n=1 Tax=Rubeoparvulum massiliense TaxID=1631346 RepID=UPI00065E383D|nr:DNA/RNA nuclease SfsA [Rubeoparvulum massiliense]
MLSLPYPQALHAARFLSRPNRFLLLCELLEAADESGTVVEVHLPDPGRLKELLLPGASIWLLPVDKPGRRTQWSAALVATPDGKQMVSLDSTLPNRLVELALQKQEIAELADWSFVSREYTMGDSRWDFLLAHPDGRKLALEVKSVTLAEKGIGLFPDAVTARGTKHVQELSQIAQQDGWEAALLFVIQRSDVNEVRPASHIDPVFAATLAKAKASGVHIFAHRCSIHLDAIHLEGSVPVVIEGGEENCTHGDQD